MNRFKHSTIALAAMAILTSGCFGDFDDLQALAWVDASDYPGAQADGVSIVSIGNTGAALVLGRAPVSLALQSITDDGVVTTVGVLEPDPDSRIEIEEPLRLQPAADDGVVLPFVTDTDGTSVMSAVVVPVGLAEASDPVATLSGLIAAAATFAGAQASSFVDIVEVDGVLFGITPNGVLAATGGTMCDDFALTAVTSAAVVNGTLIVADGGQLHSVATPGAAGSCGVTAIGDSSASALARLTAVDIDNDGTQELAADAPTGDTAYLWTDVNGSAIAFDVNEGSDSFGASFAAGSYGGTNRLAVGDPDRSIGGGTGAVYLYELAGSSLTLVETLYDSAGAELFGQGVGTVQTGSSSSTVLSVGAKDKIYTYFRICESCADAR